MDTEHRYIRHKGAGRRSASGSTVHSHFLHICRTTRYRYAYMLMLMLMLMFIMLMLFA